MFNSEKWNTLQSSQPVFAEEVIKVAMLNNEYESSKNGIYDILPDADKALFQRRKHKVVTVLLEKHIISCVQELQELAKRSV